MTVTAQPDPVTMDGIADCLRAGGVVLLPTDTVFGLAVMPGNDAAVDRLYHLKSRPRARRLPVMVANADQLRALGVDLNDRVLGLLNSPLMPGALTVAAGLDVLRTPDWLAGRDELAFRIPDDARLLAVLDLTGPLLVTSANKHGQPTPTEIDAVLAQLDGAPNLVVEGAVHSDTPSTLVNCRAEPAVIERAGAIPAAVIARYVPVQHG